MDTIAHMGVVTILEVCLDYYSEHLSDKLPFRHMSTLTLRQNIHQAVSS